jgi:hypothetical protein
VSLCSRLVGDQSRCREPLNRLSEIATLLSRNIGAGDESLMAWGIGRGGRGDSILAWGRRGGENSACAGRLAKTHGQTAIIPHQYHE